MGSKAKILVMAGIVVAMVSAPAVAIAGSGNYHLSNGCDIYWQNSWGGSPLQGSSYTNENYDCAQVMAKMYADPQGGGENWIWISSGWVNGSNSYVAKYVDQKPGTSEHWGRKTTGGTSSHITRAF